MGEDLCDLYHGVSCETPPVTSIMALIQIQIDLLHALTLHFLAFLGFTLYLASTRARTRCGQDAESNLVNPHSFRNLSAYS